MLVLVLDAPQAAAGASASELAIARIRSSSSSTSIGSSNVPVPILVLVPLVVVGEGCGAVLCDAQLIESRNKSGVALCGNSTSSLTLLVPVPFFAPFFAFVALLRVRGVGTGSDLVIALLMDDFRDELPPAVGVVSRVIQLRSGRFS